MATVNQETENVSLSTDSELCEEKTNKLFVSVSVQCGSDKTFEDSNVVLVKSWSDAEDTDWEVAADKQHMTSKKMVKREKREMKRKAENRIDDQVKKIKTEHSISQTKSSDVEDKLLMSNSNPEELRNGDVKLKSKKGDTHTKDTLKFDRNSARNLRPGYSDDRFSETSYYFEGNLRKVYPYYFTFTTFTKGRWVGEKILDVFAREFRAHPAEEYKRCIEAGSVTVNNEKVSIDYKLKHNDLLSNVVHRHEVPVTAVPIEIVYIDRNTVVVNKPPSIPVHPCGRYRHNTVVYILAKEYNLKNLRTIHRLDRLTSGILMFGRTVEKALELEYQIRNRICSKNYVCRVEGDFPYEEIECKEPIEVVSFKIGLCKVSPTGKECSTTFKKIGYNSKTNSSVIVCSPHTGRMHQIRVHLQYLGYPILRDPLYNHPVFGPEKGKGGNIGKTDEELVQDLMTIHNAENWLGLDGECPGIMNRPVDESLVIKKEEESAVLLSSADIDNMKVEEESPRKCVFTQTNHEEPDPHFRKEKLTTEERCFECKVQFRDPSPKDLVMYLHAFKYAGPNWSYETSMPEWAKVDWCEF